MYRGIIAAAVLLAAAPATAQTAREITGDAWDCRLVSLVGDPNGDMSIQFNRDGSLGADFYFEIPSGDDLVRISASVSGTWTLTDGDINMAVTQTDVNGGWLNDEELDPEVLDELAESFEGDMASFSGTSTIAYVAKHAMVLDELETSISCWR